MKGEGYPWAGESSVQAGTADYDLMDTNGDGMINMQDNAFDPFWPGGEFVDWVGTSLYWWGEDPNTNSLGNNIAPSGDFSFGEQF